ncbi:MAG: DUF1499 domain-containing protein [Ornithinimicrobium sp.]
MYILPIAALSMASAVVVSLTVRTATDDLATWHQDPASVSMPDKPNWYRLTPASTDTANTSAGEGDDREGVSPVFDVPVQQLAATFDEVAMGESRVEVLAGSAAKGFVTYIQRSTVMGYPDYITVRFSKTNDGGSTLTLLSRARYGSSDMGVNEKRVRRWIQQTQERLD